ncbi:MAG: DUF790 family protein [Oligoflexales bacterium]
MLTKDLLKHTVRQGRVYPSLLCEKDSKVLASAQNLLSIFQQHEGLTQGELDQSLQDLGLTTQKRDRGFSKLLKDQMVLSEPESFDQMRWEVYRKWPSWHKKSQGSYECFQQLVAQDVHCDFDTFGDSFYADLDENRILKKQKVSSAVELIRRYNCSQVQGLLLRAKKVIWTLKNVDVAEKRRFVRGLRFFRLLLEPYSTKDGVFRVEVSGPLSIHQQSQAYGFKLASFLTWAIASSHWELEAEVDSLRGAVLLKLDETSGLKPPRVHQASWVPEEFGSFMKGFNKSSTDWQVRAGNSFFHLGDESYCFPDMEFFSTPLKSGGTSVVKPVELFHKWHSSACELRLQQMESYVKNPPILIGVSQALAKTPHISQLIENSNYFPKNGFLFRDFPTNRKVLQLLNLKTVAC